LIPAGSLARSRTSTAIIAGSCLDVGTSTTSSASSKRRFHIAYPAWRRERQPGRRGARRDRPRRVGSRPAGRRERPRVGERPHARRPRRRRVGAHRQLDAARASGRAGDIAIRARRVVVDVPARADHRRHACGEERPVAGRAVARATKRASLLTVDDVAALLLKVSSASSL
jgi:hypothetical protein